MGNTQFTEKRDLSWICDVMIAICSGFGEFVAMTNLHLLLQKQSLHSKFHIYCLIKFSPLAQKQLQFKFQHRFPSFRHPKPDPPPFPRIKKTSPNNKAVSCFLTGSTNTAPSLVSYEGWKMTKAQWCPETGDCHCRHTVFPATRRLSRVRAAWREPHITPWCAISLHDNLLPELFSRETGVRDRKCSDWRQKYVEVGGDCFYRSNLSKYDKLDN